MLPPILDTLAFRSNNSQHQPVIDAMEWLRAHHEVRRKAIPCAEIPVAGVVRPQLQKLLVEAGPNGERIDRIDYEILSWQEERRVSNSLTLQYDRVVYLLEPTELAKGLRRRKVRVHDYPDGTVSIKYEGADLPYSTFDKVRRVRQEDIVSNKRLGAVLRHVQEIQQQEPVERHRGGPTRRGQRRIAQARFREFNPAVL